MTGKEFTAAAVAILLVAGCTGRHSVKALFDDAPLAEQCIVEEQCTKVGLKDYFPEMNGNDSITIIMGKNESFLESRTFTSGGKKASMVIANRTMAKMRNFDESLAPFISTNIVVGNDEEFYVDIDNTADSIFVLWQNTMIDECVTTIDPTRIKVTVPRNAAKMETSFIRIFAANSRGISNDILVPLNKGHIVRTLEDTDTALLARYSPCHRSELRFPKHNFHIQDSLIHNFKMDSLFRDSINLRLGDFFPLYDNTDVIAYMHNYMGAQSIVFLNGSMQEQDIRVFLPLGLIKDGANEILRTVKPHSYQIIY